MGEVSFRGHFSSHTEVHIRKKLHVCRVWVRLQLAFTTHDIPDDKHSWKSLMFAVSVGEAVSLEIRGNTEGKSSIFAGSSGEASGTSPSMCRDFEQGFSQTSIVNEHKKRHKLEALYLKKRWLMNSKLLSIQRTNAATSKHNIPWGDGQRSVLRSSFLFIFPCSLISLLVYYLFFVFIKKISPGNPWGINYGAGTESLLAASILTPVLDLQPSNSSISWTICTIMRFKNSPGSSFSKGS